MRAMAAAAARQAAVHDQAKLWRSWRSWQKAGPARGLGRRHELSRVVGGWVPSTAGVIHDGMEGVGPLEAADQPDEEGVALSEDDSGHIAGPVVAPLLSQQAVGAEADKRGEQRQAICNVLAIGWPVDEPGTADLPESAVEPV